MIRTTTLVFTALAALLTSLFSEKALEPSALKEGGLFKLWKQTASVSLSFPAESTAKVSFPDADSTGGIVSDPFGVKPGSYTLTLKTRGKGRLNAHFTFFDETKKQLSRDVQDLGQLTGDWNAVVKSIAVPKDSAFITLNFLFYKNTGEFEIAEISLERKQEAGGAPVPSGAPHQEPVGLWTFDESDRSGITVYDRQGESHGDLGEGAVITAGRTGNAVRFDGVTGAVLCDQAPYLGQNFTIAAWFKSDDLAGAQHSIYAGDTKGCHYFRVNPDGALALIRTDVKVAGMSKPVVSAGVWQHVAVTYASNGEYRFFLDGADAGSGKATGEDFVNAKHASMGAVSAGAVPRAMKGELDEVGVYDRTLSPSEIASLAQNRATQPEDPAHRAKRRPATLTIRLKSDATWNWFEFGKPVRFSAGGGLIPEEIESLRGAVTLADGKEIAVITVTRDELRDKGWIFNSAFPGYFQVSFSFQARGRSWPLVSTYNLQTTRGTVKNFSRDKQAFAVMPPVSAKPLRQFGVSIGGRDEVEVAMAKQMGFSYVRWHYIPWGALWVDPSGAIEPQKGVYKWDAVDAQMARFKKYGLEVIGNVFGTPFWASPHPEDKKIDIGVLSGNMYAPVDINDFGNFLTVLVNHFGNDIKTWELWNEPHLPGSSIFWKDSPENFVKLMKNGYAALKKAQPDCEVWVGGMGSRYLPFYREFLRLGGGDTFDRLPMHGSWANINGFRELEKSFGVKSKPWLASEWHAILVSATQKPPSESELARNMIFDLCDQLKAGAERVSVFCMNEGASEIELLPTAFADGSFQQSFGLFRTKPRSEPRLSAVVLRTFIDQCRTRLVYDSLSDLGKGLRLISFEDGGNYFSVLWNEGEKTVSLDASALTAFKGAEITGWEGYPIQSFTGDVEPSRIYYVRGLPVSFLHSLAPSTASLNPADRKNTAGLKVPSGSLSRSLDESKIVWNKDNWTYTGISSPTKREDFSAKFALTVTGSGLDLLVEVEDAVHSQTEKAPEFWRGDSVQFALDTMGRGRDGEASEFIAALTASGPVLYKLLAANVGGDLPQRWSAAGSPVQFGKTEISRSGKSTRYHIHIDQTELYPFVFDPERTKTLRLSVLVNNSSGQGREGYLEWSSGIGGKKDPAYYGKLELK